MPLREARVYYKDDWPFGANPWPWCPYAKRDKRFWNDLELPAIPHDSHIVNGGNTDCPGHPGQVDTETGVGYRL